KQCILPILSFLDRLSLDNIACTSWKLSFRANDDTLKTISCQRRKVESLQIFQTSNYHAFMFIQCDRDDCHYLYKVKKNLAKTITREANKGKIFTGAADVKRECLAMAREDKKVNSDFKPSSVPGHMLVKMEELLKDIEVWRLHFSNILFDIRMLRHEALCITSLREIVFYKVEVATIPRSLRDWILEKKC
ncbi:hypothetical protein PFISCL1PPCAC_3094, partial [Pristionchus fissidentatus]